ncbi:MAG: metallophosphoesterase [Candidatus Nanoarchaeia archaeon]
MKNTKNKQKTNYLPIVLFISFFFIIYFGMQYYALHRILGFFAETTKIWIYALLLSITFPLFVLLDRFFHSRVTSILYAAASSLLGTVFLLICALILLEPINIFYPLFKIKLVGFALIGFITLLSLISIINAYRLKVKKIEINNFGKNITAVHLSDIHIGTVRNSKFLTEIVKKTNELSPDVIFITGDLFDGSGKITKETVSPLNKLKAPTYLIMGNHEFYEGEDKVTELLKSTKVIVLRNSLASCKGIQIIGLDYSEKKTYVAEQLDMLQIKNPKKSTQPSILLNHVPIGYNDAEKRGIKVQLSGHTHGGQVFPFSLLTRLVFPKYKGLYTTENFSIYISQGTGTWGPPMRLGTHNEITLISFRK